MYNFKKILSSVLAVTTIAGTLALGTSAKSYSDVSSDYKYAEQINIISDIGITVGTGENQYSPDAPVSREQMALLLYRLMVGNDNAGKVNTSPFKDLLDDTYNGAISWAYANGYILGTSDTTFEPTAGITLKDAMTMLVRILGHETDSMAQGYPWTYINSAVKIDLDLDLEDVSYDKKLTRGETAAILYNALTAEYLVPKTTVNGITLYEATTIIEKIFGYKLEEATIVATNDFATGEAVTVVKDGYVSLAYDDNGTQKMITAKYADLGLDGDANSNLGKRVKLVYSVDSSKNIDVLGATEISREEIMTDGIVVNENKDKNEFDYVTIGDTKYQVVESYSDKLATNANELLVFAYNNGSKLTQIKTNEELHDLLGIYEARVIFDDRNDKIASRIILKPYAFDKLEISSKGEYNIANDLKKDELEGGFINTVKAEDGEYVLYYFNEENESLEIAEIIPVSASQTVNRLTDDSARLGDKTYKLGCEALGITAASIKSQLSIGEKVRVVAVNGMILAVEDSIESGAASNYLIAITNSRPVFTDGKFGYAVKVNIDGDTISVFSDSEDVVAGRAYRYTVSDDNVYSLIPYVVNSGVISSGNDQFVQNNGTHSEIAVIIDEAKETVITNNNVNFKLDSGDASFISSLSSFGGEISFVTDKNTVIVISEDDGNGNYSYSVRKGQFDGNITIADDAYVAAIFDNETGSVETLRYLFISDGAFAGATSSINAVKVLEEIGTEYADGKIYTVYNALNLDTGDVEHIKSTSSELVIGGNYKLNNDGTISAVAAEIQSGIITGYTAGTVTIGNVTYTLDNDVNIFEIDEDFDVTSHKLSSAYMSNVEFVMDDDKITSIIILGDAPMTASYAEGKINVVLGFELDGITKFSVKSLKKDGKAVDISEFSMSRDDKNIEITASPELEAGEYTLVMNLNSGSSTVEFTVE